MKKLIGLLATSSLVMLAACSDDESSSPAAPVDSGSSTLVTPELCQSMSMVFYTDPTTGVSACISPVQSSSDMNGTLGQSSSSLDALPALSSSSDAAPVAASSSSLAPAPASSSPAPTSSAPAADDTPADDGLFKIGLWDGSKGTNQVPTGNKDGGYWYSYTDKGNKGASTLEWNATAAVGSTYSDDDLSPIIAECGGLCGKFNLVAGSNEDCAPYVAVAFNYGKTDKTAADATSSKGICVTYKSTMAIEVDMGLGSKDESYGYNLPAYVLDPATSETTVDIAWSEFKQQWDGAKALTGPEAAAMLAAIKFQVKGSAVGEDDGEGTFLISKVGAPGQCGN
jgi:hypothetical protein